MMVLAVARAGETLETDVERMRQYCQTQGWHLAEPLLWAEGTAELGPLVARVTETGVKRVLLTRTVLTELEGAYPTLWATTRARLERQGVIAVGV
jgi:hypothetical protein